MTLNLPAGTIISSSTDSQKLGQDWMEQMIGPGYDQYQQEMIDMMGPEFFSQLQEAAGKSLQRGQSYLMAPIMGGGYGWRGDDWGRAMGWSVLNGWMHSGWGWLAVFFGIAIAAIAVGIPIGILILIILLIVRMARSIRPTKKEDK